MRFWSAFASIAILPIVAADFYTALVKCNTSHRLEVDWAIVPGNVVPGSLGACQDTVQHWIVGITHSGSLTNGSVCNTDISVDGTRNHWYAAGLSGECTKGDGGTKCSRVLDGAECQYSVVSNCTGPPPFCD
ncbi:uncharacterized protein EI90DRAFT_3085353 [Cantharellus anzutake]|uniref:uncharacterized protein n=1 Tax=Cantharellus anzutake TaxID=1750568 RepID=UPI001907A8E8|nr:uncharacterized protein EI90DRAFT_3085353 [Cantharellus anzutake]KAF8317235.1 hypothetical protein EI90DRAFT_3085353 [Cantharellus anzutake]